MNGKTCPDPSADQGNDIKKRTKPPHQPTGKVIQRGQPPEAHNDTATEVQLPDDYAQWLDERTFDAREDER